MAHQIKVGKGSCYKPTTHVQFLEPTWRGESCLLQGVIWHVCHGMCVLQGVCHLTCMLWRARARVYVCVLLLKNVTVTIKLSLP